MSTVIKTDVERNSNPKAPPLPPFAWPLRNVVCSIKNEKEVAEPVKDTAAQPADLLDTHVSKTTDEMFIVEWETREPERSPKAPARYAEQPVNIDDESAKVLESSAADGLNETEIPPPKPDVAVPLVTVRRSNNTEDDETGCKKDVNKPPPLTPAMQF